MKDGPGIVGIAALIGDHTRADILTSLMAGQALTASELASATNVTKQTVSTHLAKLLDAQLLVVEAQGRHRYYRLADDDVAHLLESLMGVAFRTGAVRARQSPREPALRNARVCYDHLAGDVGVRIYDSLCRQGVLMVSGRTVEVSPSGEAFFSTLGVEVAALTRGKRPVCRTCLDWSVRRHHLAGSLGAALLERVYALGWAKRVRGTRIVQFTPRGEKALRDRFAAAPDSVGR